MLGSNHSTSEEGNDCRGLDTVPDRDCVQPCDDPVRPFKDFQSAPATDLLVKRRLSLETEGELSLF